MGLRTGCGGVVLSILTMIAAGCSSSPTAMVPPSAAVAPRHISAVAPASSPRPIYAMPYVASTPAGVNHDLRVMTFNLRVSTVIDGMNNWAFRKGMVVERIRSFDPDILGTQEGKDGQCDFLQEELPAYTFFGAGR